MRIFFDTEFTGLTTDAKLISIGLVDESGQHEFYAELSDTYMVADRSDFCRQEALPLLQGGPARLTLAELRQQLRDWLCARRDNPVLVCDSPKDVVQQLALRLRQGVTTIKSVQVRGHGSLH